MKKKGLLIIIILIAVLLALLLQPNPYFRRAMYYLTANIDDYRIFPSRTIEANPQAEWELHPEYNQAQVSQKADSLFREKQSVAYLIIKDSMILQEIYFQDSTRTSVVNSFSMAKSITSILTGIAIDKGFVESINDPVTKYLPGIENKNLEGIRIIDLLNMSSGLEWNEVYWNPFSATTKAYYGNNLKRLFQKIKSAEEPGNHWKYLSANTQLLGFVISESSGMPLSEFAEKYLWQPIQAQENATWSTDKTDGNEKAFCCFNSNARDFARIGQLVLNKGVWEKDTIVSPEYIQQMIEPATYLHDSDNEEVDFYGLSWWILNIDNQQIPYARGVAGQYIFVIPEKNMVVVRLGHKRSSQYKDHHPTDTYEYVKIAFEMLEQVGEN